MKVRVCRKFQSLLSPVAKFMTASLVLLIAGCGSSHSPAPPAAAAPTVTITATPASITAGSASKLTITATNATAVTVSGSDGTNYTMATTGGTQSVTPAATCANSLLCDNVVHIFDVAAVDGARAESVYPYGITRSLCSDGRRHRRFSSRRICVDCD